MRAALAATIVVALILAISAVAFVVLQRRQLEATLSDVAAQQAAAVAADVARNGAASADVTPAGRSERALVQVLTRDGDVVVSSPSIAGEPPMVGDRPAPGQIVVLRAGTLPVEEEAFAVVVRGVEGPDGEAVVISAQSLETAQRATEVLIRLLALGYPILLLLVAGTSYWLTGRALAPVEAMRRRVAGITATDLTARVPVPPSLDEVAQLATTMNAMLDRLGDAADAQRRFVADASHELRSPLATIRAAHEIAVVHPEVTDWAVVHADVLAEVQRLERLVDDLLFLARSDEHGPRSTPEDVDLDDLLSAEAGRLRRTTGLRIVVQETPVRVVGDRHQLARALRNLTDNAARHATDRVELRVSRQGAEAVIDVIDDGPGIPAPVRERVFERFVRLDPSRQRGAGGTGLGLAIAREIARAHGGELSVVDHDGGAHLQLSIPLSDPDRPHPTV
ncbi:ATP-binding protein [Blastococcus sp. CT_GayMR16]|uniref:ATP-binding protein n=1 Tax=Blastococcus sp. CT_GayMR16 TaxID=2559607 RepID=UPI00142FE50C|nr:ATP-binding protein [Blastococcus sp. CT_GayMR16]